MKSQIQEALDNFGIKDFPKASSPANCNLYFIDEDSPSLSTTEAEVFHSTVAKMLYITKQARNDLETTVTFLCTRVSKSTRQDWDKLRCLLGFVHDTIDDLQYIGATSLSDLYT